ncbi:MAG: hypothetical protein HND58_06295 [Planctomycetota bacterium]|nr:MAG: hypothetical protein HND58_06295 [Planctomycetota bacterium]
MKNEWDRPLYPRVDAGIIQALRPVLWPAMIGLAIVFVDITFSSWSSVQNWSSSAAPQNEPVHGFTIDLVHDALGYLLITVAVARLHRTHIPARAKRFLGPVAGVLVLGVLLSLCNMVLGWQSGPLGMVNTVFHAFAYAALVAMIWTIAAACRSAGAARLERTWLQALWMVVVIWAVPASITIVVALASGQSRAALFQMDLSSPMPVCGLLALVAVPLVWILLAFSRTLAWVPPARLTHCHRCGYLLEGLPEPACPECGERFATMRGSMEPGVWHED